MHEIAETDLRAEIERLEERIEELSAQLANCRKFAFAARIAMAVGGLVLAAAVVGAIRLDVLSLATAIAALLGGVVLAGSNRSTANEAAAQLAATERDRAALIGRIELRVVSDRPTLH